MNALASILEPLALGLSTGTWCVGSCAPALVPFLFAQSQPGHARNAGLVGVFLAGRLAAYAALGAAFAALGLLATEAFQPVLARRLSLLAYTLCGIALLADSLVRRRCASCASGATDAAKESGRSLARWADHYPFCTAALAGISVALHLCPPFWSALFRAAAAPSLLSGGLYFLLFYAGTLPFFIPLAAVPFGARAVPSLRGIARIAQLFIAVYFILFLGIIPFVFGR